MIDVVPITLWDLFKTLCMGKAFTEFNDILFKASRKTFKFIQEDFNKKICLADEKSKEVKVWKEKNDKRDMERRGYQVTLYSYIFPPSGIRPPSYRDPVDKLVRWNTSGIQSLDALSWLNLHKRGWEHAELLNNNIME